MSVSGDKGQEPDHSVSVVLLAFNEALSLPSVLDETLAFCTDALRDFEIIVVDDGSTDRTAAIAAEFAKKDARIKLVSHSQNLGMGAGMRTGLRLAQKKHFVFNAADGQVAASEIGRMLPSLDRADMVLTTYENRRESLARDVMSRGFRFYLRIVAGIRFRLTGLYLFPTAIAQDIEPLIRANTFFFSFELIQRAIEKGLSYHAVPIACRPRYAGRSKIARFAPVLRVSRDALVYGATHRGPFASRRPS